MQLAVAGAGAIWIAGGLALGQVNYHVVEIDSPLPGPHSFPFGSTLLARDMNRDGFCDLIVAEPGYPSQGVEASGRLLILYGPNFANSKAIYPTQPLELGALGANWWGNSSSIGDVNGDGLLDLAITAPQWPYISPTSPKEVGAVQIFIGPDYSEQHTLYDPTPDAVALFGNCVALADSNGDGREDVYVGVPNASADGSPSQLCGVHTAWQVGEVWRFEYGALGPSPFVNPAPICKGGFGGIIRVADWDGDGLNELLISSWEKKTPLITHGTGTLEVYRSLDGALLTSILPPDGNPPYGYRGFGEADALADFDGDGTNDLLVSAWFADKKIDALSVNVFMGAVLLMPGPTFTTVGKEFLSGNWQTSRYFGQQTQAADINNDGHLDVIVGDPYNGVGLFEKQLVWAYYGPTFDAPQSLKHASGLPSAGHGVALAVGDFDADGVQEIVAANAAQNNLSYYHLQTLAALPASVSLSVGGSVRLPLDLGPSQAHKMYLGALGNSGTWPGTLIPPNLYLPLNQDGLTALGLSLLGTPYLGTFAGALDASGSASLSLVIPPGLSALGLGDHIDVAAFSFDSAALGLASTPAKIQLLP